MSHPDRIKFKGAVYVRVVEADQDDPMYNNLKATFQDQANGVVKLFAAAHKQAEGAVKNAFTAAEGFDFNGAGRHLGKLKQAAEALSEQLGEKLGEVEGAFGDYAGVAMAGREKKAPQPAAASFKKV